MSRFGVWGRFGFRENPYSEATLPADEVGDRLLAGRDREIAQLQMRIGSSGTFPAVEGPIGAGKTSLVNVASFRMTRQNLKDGSGEFYIPAADRFQPQNDSDEFEARVYQVVAQTLVNWKDEFQTAGLEPPKLDLLNDWLNEPQYGSWQGGGGIAGFNASYGRAKEPNTSEGFLKSGFPNAVRRALDEAFPLGNGGVICIMDNLEILETTGAARKSLDELRDRVFNIPQLRWVLCGSRGIVSRARSERLSGIFQAPIVIPSLDDRTAVAAIEERITYYGDDASVPPVTPAGFDFLYKALNSNMRDALSHAQEFSHWLANDYDPDQELPADEDRHGLLQAWLAERASDAFADATSVQPRAWEFFQQVCRLGGRIGSSEHGRMGFTYQQQMTAAVSSLVSVNLMVREVDPDDGNRTINAITSLGWLVYFYRNDFKMPQVRVSSRIIEESDGFHEQHRLF